uniref:Protein kinase domain-containing protein n=3 Tax=Cuerna arida TaxID=1464854 RepID=A0A1B6FYQ8_9HEMI
MNMNTSEVLDLSKENIQPLKQGRNAAKLGTALQAQTNAELHQKLLAEREEFELLIRMYEGDDPLKPHYDYVRWIEQSFPKHGPESNLVQILENTLTAFKDDERYKQDVRYAELLIKYIDTQPNPVEIYQLVYNQGLCTMCAPFYKAWADELDKHNDVKNADQVYELGIRVNAQPLELLKEAHLRFQLSVGRRMLGRQDECDEEELEYNRQALHKLHKQNVYSVRDPKGAPGQVKQQTLGSRNSQSSGAPFKVYQGEDNDYNAGESQGKMFPKQKLVNKENALKAGPWTQHGGKHRSRVTGPITPTPTFQVHEDEGADVGSGTHKTPSVPRALKPRKIDNFTCPLAVFEPPDPTKKPMYCKSKVYAGGREFQFEELRAALYNRRYEQLEAMRIQQEIQNEVNAKQHQEDHITDEDNVSIPEKDVDVPTSSEKDPNITPVKPQMQKSVTPEPTYEQHLQSPIPSAKAFECKTVPLEANTSLFHCQSFTVNTKEAMNVVQEMWNSPSPAPGFGKTARSSRVFPASPVALDESGVFKVPPVPPPPCRADDEDPAGALKLATPSFPIYCDDEPTPAPASVPSLTPASSQPFQIYSDDMEPEPQPTKKNVVDSENVQNLDQAENAPLPLPPFHPIAKQPMSQFGRAHPPGTDAATLKMLAFDSDDSCDEMPMPSRKTADNFKPHHPLLELNNIPTVSVTAPTPVIDKHQKTFGEVISHPVFQDEDKYDDMTCNTKAFDFVLPSSTPLVGHLKSANNHQASKQNINGSYIAEDVKKCGTNTKQELSMIFEASKERYSSSSGSSGSKTQASVCTAANTSLAPGQAQAELMEKLAQISANKSLEELEKSVGLLNISGPVDPFCTELISQLLSHIGYPKKHHLIGLHRFENDAPILNCNSTVKLGNTKYSLIGELGKGSYARVLKATRDGQPVALKQQRPAWEWEWYIVQELQSRLPPNKMGGYLHMSNGYVYKNGSILESEWAQYGSILSVVSKLKIAGKGHDLHLAMLFSIQMISIVEHLHNCKIIHGDIKPDNFVLCSVPSADVTVPCLKLIDFGRSIDMTLFPEGTTFTKVVTTDGFQCNEMKEGRPWTYQTDLYGLAGSIYSVLFYDYMKVVKKDKKWQLSNKIPRYMMPAVWQDVFTPLLNVESCENIPDLSALREILEQPYRSMDLSTVNQSINKLRNILLNK